MKKVTNKKLFYFVAALGATFFMTMTGCKKSESSVTDPQSKIISGNVSLDNVVSDLKKIKSLGFDPLNVEVIPGGYRVEGDIRLTKKNLDESFSVLSQQQGQYSTKYPLSVVRTINVGLYNATGSALVSEALDSTLSELNSIKLPLKFVRVADTAKADIITLFKDLGGKTPSGTTLGQDGDFVNAKGNPGRYIYLNSNADAGINNSSRTFITGLLGHEFGHAIGLRHTDYQNRVYSALTSNGKNTDPASQDKYITQLTQQLVDNKYGKGTWSQQTAADQATLKKQVSDAMNEGNPAGKNADATHIYGTPLSPVYGANAPATDPISIMLAYAFNPAHKYSPYDCIALFGLYGNPSQTRLIGNSLSETGTVTAPGMTLQQVVDAVKALGPNNN
ncbi:M57 family metalloprotease [Pedobacter cryoconitis]|uniref:Putative Zn-dependent protease n=1 Tax=Pedobacter cryoconitis TaxID=188932 RepID=A0A7X0J1L6_9SPHI|nr:M57 family metalloprotease [Pedobacter cryoconitis]MBB6498772.1 putative Zn-dependent protease [Pedobacter cryoconitis]